MKLRWLSLTLILLLAFPFGQAHAQDTLPPGPVYVIQAGDNIWDIAQQFGLSVDELVNYNHIADPNLLKIGDRLVIPRLEDIQGELKIVVVPYGETQRSLSRRYQLPETMLARLNHLASPDLLYTGVSLVILDTGAALQPTRRGRLAPGESLLEQAVIQDTDSWSLVSLNHLKGNWDGLPGDVLVAPGEGESGPGALPPEIGSFTITPLPLIQGKTIVLRVTASSGASFTGSLAGHALNFFPDGQGQYVALQGIYALQEPGLYPLDLSVVLPDGASFQFNQSVSVVEGAYIYDPTLYVDPATIDPEVTRPEDAEWNALAAPVTLEKLWSGMFLSPVAPEFSGCFPSRFGNRRSYNDGPYNYFHTGLDFCGAVGNAIFASASGVVVFAGPLSVRGNATMINLGWGVYTAYMHQSEILVQVGDQVEAGHQIGMVGATGRVTGAHLHFEVWVGGVQVDPMDWLGQAYP